jgi:hypothetical protein
MFHKGRIEWPPSAVLILLADGGKRELNLDKIVTLNWGVAESGRSYKTLRVYVEGSLVWTKKLLIGVNHTLSQSISRNRFLSIFFSP